MIYIDLFKTDYWFIFLRTPQKRLDLHHDWHICCEFI